MATLTIQDFETPHAPSWCPGCGDFPIWDALKKALVTLTTPPHQVLICYGIGCSGNMVNIMRTYGFHALHGRALPVAIGVKLANGQLTVIVVAGDGDAYGEGLSHFIHAIRSNVDITYIVHDNKVFGLTTGQAAPTATKGFRAKSTPEGSIDESLNPVALALAGGATFVARGFSGRLDHLTNIFIRAIQHPGFSFVDVLQPCVTFNRVHTYAYYNKIVEELDRDQTYKINDRQQALTKALNVATLPIGIFFQDRSRPHYLQELSYLKGTTLVSRETSQRDITRLYADFR